MIKFQIMVVSARLVMAALAPQSKCTSPLLENVFLFKAHLRSKKTLIRLGKHPAIELTNLPPMIVNGVKTLSYIRTAEWFLMVEIEKLQIFFD